MRGRSGGWSCPCQFILRRPAPLPWRGCNAASRPQACQMMQQSNDRFSFRAGQSGLRSHQQALRHPGKFARGTYSVIVTEDIVRVTWSPEYQAIRQHYADRVAQRSGVPLLQRIDEGRTGAGPGRRPARRIRPSTRRWGSSGRLRPAAETDLAFVVRDAARLYGAGGGDRKLGVCSAAKQSLGRKPEAPSGQQSCS